MAKKKRAARRRPSERRRRELAARKAWATRRARARARERARRARSLAAKKGWETRRRLERQRRQEEERRAKRPPRKKPKKPKKRPVDRPERRKRREEPVEPRKRRAPKRPEKPRREQSEAEIALAYFKLVLHSTCGRLRDEDVVCTVRTHREGDGSVSAEIVVPVYAEKPSEVRRLLITVEELDGWRQIPGPLLRKAWVSIIFRVEAGAWKEGEEPKYKVSPSRGTYNAPTNYHRLENAPYAFQIARDDILPGLVEMSRVVVAIIMRVRYMPDGEHPSRPRI